MAQRKLPALLSAAAVVPLAALAVAGCGGGYTSTAAKPTTSTGRTAAVGVAAAPGLGRILVDSHGRTLYLFEGDRGTRSTCTGACATAWPPLRSGRMPVSGSGIDASKIGVTSRSGGGRQITYNGHPLYRFQGDHAPGDRNGQGSTAFGASWVAVSPSGNAVSGSESSSGGYGGY